MQFTKDQISEALKHVVYPENQKDIISLNMVEEIKIDGNQVILVIALAKATNPFKNSLQRGCVDIIKIYVDKEIDVKVEFRIKETHKKEENKEQEPFHSLTKVKNIIAVASGKGGVGKSTIAANLAVSLAKMNYKVGLIDADVFGPSQPKMFNEEGYHPELIDIQGKNYVIPVQKYGVKLLSIGFFVDPDSALVWRGPMATQAIKQLLLEADWGELDYLFIDLPPGTSDVHITIVQTVAVTGAIIVSTPQNVAIADVIKGIGMFKAKNINVPLLGLVENMAWFTPAELPNNKYYLFGKDGCKNLAEKLQIPLLGQIPIYQSICEDSDKGTPSALSQNTPYSDAFDQLAKNMLIQVEERNKNLPQTNIVQITR